MILEQLAAAIADSSAGGLASGLAAGLAPLAYTVRRVRQLEKRTAALLSLTLAVADKLGVDVKLAGIVAGMIHTEEAKP